VVGKALGAAKRAIVASHCSTKRVKRAWSRKPAGRVLAVNPKAGTPLEKGAGVALTVSRGPHKHKKPKSH
jgi:beta-lactam-binding protein with PASTA domain